ncbi:DUF1801 domain-containing protein [Enterococcus sp. AZ163]|uniref:DUF1801 domain-containing protein n=1 Tax=Enterococcus sp. AZ163 TaxID=2774638 RepID=UPI003D2C7350
MITIQEFYPTYSEEMISKLEELQNLIWTIAKEQKKTISESSKWGQLSIVSEDGTPIRIAKFSDNEIALFVHCQTTLIETWKNLFPDRLSFSGNRAVIVSVDSPLPASELQVCIDMALNYHARNKRL